MVYGGDIIYEKFLRLSEDKQDKILRAALGEFGKYGYKKTSVEQIAKEAQISKSMIFHYFQSKLGLYEYLVKYSLETVYKTYENYVDKLESLDYIEQYEQASKVKLLSFKKNPELFEFLFMIHQKPENSNISSFVEENVKKIIDYRNEVLGKIIHQENDIYFKDDIEINLAKKYINWIIDGYSNELTLMLDNMIIGDSNFDAKWKEYDKIISDLKKLFYKEEYQ